MSKMKPKLKAGMSTFVGCAVGEMRSGWHKNAPGIAPYINLAKTGYLTATEEGSRVWFALTPKGKEHVARVELYFASKF